MKKIHVGFLLSYDYDKLKVSIPPVYKEADRIFIAIDENLTTWSGNKFEIKPQFFEWLEKFDIDKKIEIYRDNFYVPNLTGIQMDTRERHLLSLKMGIGNWLVQVDSDEYFLDFAKYVKELRKYDSYLDNPQAHPIQISGYHIDIYKYLEDGLLYVKNTCKVLLATNYPNYKYARQTRERIVYVDAYTLHESLSRSLDELEYKLKNWSHREDVNPTFLEKWKKANKDNYNEIKDVFYLNPKQWKDLGYVPTKDINEMQKYFDSIDDLKVTKFYLMKKNFGQWFKHLKIFKLNKKTTFEKYF
jgi:hypothetical protein